MVQMIGIRNDAFHELIPGQNLIFYDEMLFQTCTYSNFSLASMLEHLTRRPYVDHSEI